MKFVTVQSYNEGRDWHYLDVEGNLGAGDVVEVNLRSSQRYGVVVDADAAPGGDFAGGNDRAYYRPVIRKVTLKEADAYRRVVRLRQQLREAQATSEDLLWDQIDRRRADAVADADYVD